LKARMNSASSGKPGTRFLKRSAKEFGGPD
jgi:hypothetical protein